MTTTTNVEQVKLNIMTTSQYDNSSKSDTELYVLTDATAMPMDNELSLSSENPVKNNVITARSNQIQTELDDKLNKSTVWNKLNRAYGWTYVNHLGEGSARIIVGTSSYGYVISQAISCNEVIESSYPNELVNFVCLDNTIYYVNHSNQTITLTQKMDNVSNFAYLNSNNTNAWVISNGNLYSLSESSSTLKDSGGWTKISLYPSGSTNVSVFGIKEDNLYYLTTSNITLKDASGVWTDVVGYCSSSYYGLGIKDGKLYFLTLNGPQLLSSETGWNLSFSLATSINSANACSFIIRNSNLYSVNGYTKDVTLIDSTEQWIKVSRYYGLTSSGKLYYFSGSNTTQVTITQIGSDTNWTDLSNGNVAINNGDVYLLNDNNTPVRITTTGDITKVYGTLRTADTSNFYGNCVCWSGTPIDDIHNVYTVASPSLGYNTYLNTNLDNYGTINSINLSPYTITDEHYTYTRNSNIDGVFSNISEDSSNQLMSMRDFLMCFTE